MSKIADNILAILADCRIEGTTVFLPNGQLDRATYTAVNKVLENLGGKWNRKAKGHVFDFDPTDGFENLLATGETADMKKVFQFFATPRPLAEKLVQMAELQTMPCVEHCSVLEPSAGDGAIADVLYEELGKTGRNGELICVELNEDMKRYLSSKPYVSLYCDFLSVQANAINPPCRIVMNPPFAKQQDIDHILHAYSLLGDGGILVAVMSVSPFFRTDRKSLAFVEWLDSVSAEVEDVPEGAFKQSGTMVRTKIIKVRKGEDIA